MKKSFALILSLVLLFTVSISAYAAGQDDGKLKVATKEDKTYLGTPVSTWCTYYVAADGSNSSFHRWDIDLNDDGEMNVCDLVKSIIDGTDINSDGKYDYTDSERFRVVLLGNNDY